MHDAVPFLNPSETSNPTQINARIRDQDPDLPILPSFCQENEYKQPPPFPRAMHFAALPGCLGRFQTKAVNAEKPHGL